MKISSGKPHGKQKKKKKEKWRGRGWGGSGGFHPTALNLVFLYPLEPEIFPPGSWSGNPPRNRKVWKGEMGDLPGNQPWLTKKVKGRDMGVIDDSISAKVEAIWTQQLEGFVWVSSNSGPLPLAGNFLHQGDFQGLPLRVWGNSWPNNERWKFCSGNSVANKQKSRGGVGDFHPTLGLDLQLPSVLRPLLPPVSLVDLDA